MELHVGFSLQGCFVIFLFGFCVLFLLSECQQGLAAFLISTLKGLTEIFRVDESSNRNRMMNLHII